MGRIKIKTKFVEWFCKECGYTYKLEVEEDEKTTNMWCVKCQKKMFRVKDEKEMRK